MMGEDSGEKQFRKVECDFQISKKRGSEYGRLKRVGTQ